MRWTDGFIAVDWGTSNRRAYRIDREGTCVSTIEDGLGIMSVAPGGYPAAVKEIQKKFGDLPILMAGMVGSNRGWIDAAYVPCPASIDDLASNLCWIEPGRIAIVPGLSILSEGVADVMRGEEVQLLGAVASGLIPPDALVCHPGTHNKWVKLQSGKIVSFRTVMTGEMFGLLGKHGILSDLLDRPVSDGDAFRAGVRRGRSLAPLTAELFSIRARVLLGDLPREDAASFASGLLIGADVGVGLSMVGDEQIILMGRPELTALYVDGLRDAGRDAVEVDGATAFLAGSVAIARTIR